MDSSDTLGVDPRQLEPAVALASDRGSRVAFLVADLRSRRRWAESLGEHAARRLADLHDRIARSVMKKHEGRKVGPSGEYLMVFGEPDQALDFALAYFQALDKLGQGGATEVVPGVGIHFGRDGDRDREIARKLASLAGDRRILLTRDAFEETRPRAEISHGVCWQAFADAADGENEPLEVVEVDIPLGMR
jgi:class 3 adenylate cyclase